MDVIPPEWALKTTQYTEVRTDGVTSYLTDWRRAAEDQNPTCPNGGVAWPKQEVGGCRAWVVLVL